MNYKIVDMFVNDKHYKIYICPSFTRKGVHARVRIVGKNGYSRWEGRSNATKITKKLLEAFRVSFLEWLQEPVFNGVLIAVGKKSSMQRFYYEPEEY